MLTSRMADLAGKEAAEMKAKIETWLDRHSLAYTSVHNGQGKPPAHAYIDDKGVSCRPEYDGQSAFTQALGLVAKLCE